MNGCCGSSQRKDELGVTGANSHGSRQESSIKQVAVIYLEAMQRCDADVGDGGVSILEERVTLVRHGVDILGQD